MSTALTGMVFNARRGRLKRTGQGTTYARGDDGATRRGLLEQFDIETLGQYSGTVNIEVAHYANNGISFVAPNTVNDAGAGLVTVLAADTIVIKGSASNDGTYTVLAGAAAGSFTTVQNTIVNEGAGAYVKLYKRTSHSNNCVRDLRTGLMWSRSTSNGERVGEASNGTLIWGDPTKVYPVHPAAADLAMVVPGNTLRIVGGAAELPRYHAGDLLAPAGFANAANNLPCAYVLSVAVNGADLDIVLDPLGLPAFVAEAAGGARSIGLVTRSVFNYAAGARTALLGGHSDWRPPNWKESDSLLDHEAPSSYPDAAAFPGWADYIWCSTSYSFSTTFAMVMRYDRQLPVAAARTAAYATALVRP